MALTVQDAANRLLGKTSATWNVSASGLPGTVLLEIAKLISRAEQEMREINPAAFGQPLSILLDAPATITVTVSGTTSKTIVVTSGALPGPGCTVLISGDTYHNRVLQTTSTTAGTLQRPHEGGNASGLSATVWHDCWAPGDGASFERILGEARCNGRGLMLVTNEAELDTAMRRSDFGEFHVGYETPYAGEVRAAWPESVIASDNGAIESRLRFAAMPSAATMIQANVVTRAADCRVADIGVGIASATVANPTVVTTSCPHGLTTGDSVTISDSSGSTPTINGTHTVTVTGATTFTVAVNVTVAATANTGKVVLATTRKVSVPGGSEELYFMPILTFHWMSTPWFKPDADQRRTIETAYQRVHDKLPTWRPVMGVQPVFLTGGR